MPRDPSSYGLYWLVAVMLLHTITHSAYRQYDIRYVFKSFVIICTYHMCVCVFEYVVEYGWFASSANGMFWAQCKHCVCSAPQHQNQYNQQHNVMYGN